MPAANAAPPHHRRAGCKPRGGLAFKPQPSQLVQRANSHIQAAKQGLRLTMWWRRYAARSFRPLPWVPRRLVTHGYCCFGATRLLQHTAGLFRKVDISREAQGIPRLRCGRQAPFSPLRMTAICDLEGRTSRMPSRTAAPSPMLRMRSRTNPVSEVRGKC